MPTSQSVALEACPACNPARCVAEEVCCALQAPVWGWTRPARRQWWPRIWRIKACRTVRRAQLSLLASTSCSSLTLPSTWHNWVPCRQPEGEFVTHDRRRLWQPVIPPDHILQAPLMLTSLHRQHGGDADPRRSMLLRMGTAVERAALWSFCVALRTMAPQSHRLQSCAV